MSKAFAFVAALACFLPTVVACSSSNDTGTASTKKDSGSSDDSSDDASGDDDSGSSEDAGPACTASAHAAALTSASKGGGIIAVKNPTTCKTCLAKACPDLCAATDALNCGTSCFTSACAAATPDAGPVVDSGATEAGSGGDGGAGGACATLARCCPLIKSTITSCDQTAAGGNESACQAIVTGVNGTVPVCN